LGIHARSQLTWILDIVGLIIQGMVVPLLQTLLLAKVLMWCLPSYQGSIEFSPLAAFALSFIGVDYLYYWNHRFLHSERLWALHKVHHSIEKLDILATSRNSLWTVFFIVYLWCQALFVFLLKNPEWFLAGLTVGYSLDVWRHSGWRWNRENVLVQTLRFVLIDPQDHEWHHSNEKFHVNYGANLNIWDRLHGTFYRNPERPVNLGVTVDSSFWRQFIAPWRLR
jgi:sterol desaturase/sphingolipid hydroxylase (fatty acid hydroxylase superfamily)